jgi:hypothetical protein
VGKVTRGIRGGTLFIKKENAIKSEDGIQKIYLIIE